MFELADSGSSGGLSLYLSISLSLFLSRPLLVLSSRCVSLLRYLSTCYVDVVPCCVGTGVRDRVASDRARTLSSISSVSSLPPLRPFSSTFPCLVSVFLSLSLFSVSFFLFIPCTTGSRFLSFPTNEQADRAWAARITFPSIPGRFHDPTYTFGCTCSRDIPSRPVARSQSTCCTVDFLPMTYSSMPKAISATENCIVAYIGALLPLSGGVISAQWK